VHADGECLRAAKTTINYPHLPTNVYLASAPAANAYFSCGKRHGNWRWHGERDGLTGAPTFHHTYPCARAWRRRERYQRLPPMPRLAFRRATATAT